MTPPKAPRLKYKRGPDECPTEEDFRGEVATHLDGLSDHFDPNGTAFVVVFFRKLGPDFVGILQYTNDAGERQAPIMVFRSNCDFVSRAIGTIAAGYIPKALWQRDPQPPPAPPPPAAPPCDPCAANAEDKFVALRRRDEALGARIAQLELKLGALQRDLDDERKKKRRMDLTGVLSAGTLITVNLTSNVGPAVYVGGELQTGPLALGLEARAVLPAPVYFKVPPSAGVVDFDLSQIVGLLTPCGRYLYFFGCAVAGAGVQIGYDSDPRDPSTDFHPLVQLGGRLGAELPFGATPLGLRAWGEVLYSTPRVGVDYHIPEGTFSWDRPDVSAFFGVGLVYKLGGKGAR